MKNKILLSALLMVAAIGLTSSAYAQTHTFGSPGVTILEDNSICDGVNEGLLLSGDWCMVAVVDGQPVDSGFRDCPNGLGILDCKVDANEDIVIFLLGSSTTHTYLDLATDYSNLPPVVTTDVSEGTRNERTTTTLHSTTNLVSLLGPTAVKIGLFNPQSPYTVLSVGDTSIPEPQKVFIRYDSIPREQTSEIVGPRLVESCIPATLDVNCNQIGLLYDLIYYQAFSPIDNRYQTILVGFDYEGNPVKYQTIDGIRYVSDITYNPVADTLTFVGQSNTHIMPLADLGTTNLSPIVINTETH